MTMMHSGRLVSPDNDEVPTLRDIVRGLARQVRFAGQSGGVFTVLQHTSAMAMCAEDRDLPYILLHDSTEAVMTDMPRPWKDEVLMAREDALLGRISKAHGLQWPWPEDVVERVKDLDYMCACAEALELGYENSDPRDWCRPWVEPDARMKAAVRKVAGFWSLWMEDPDLALDEFVSGFDHGMAALAGEVA